MPDSLATRTATAPEEQQEDVRAEVPAQSPSPTPSISVTPPAASSKGFLNRINPLKFFQRESPDNLVRNGRELEKNRNFAQATVAFNRALALDPDCAEAYEGLGDVLAKKGGRANVEAAVLQYQEASKRDPFDDRVYAALARVFDALGKRKEAALEKKKLVVARTLRADPSNPVANNNMGIMLLQLGWVPAAIEHFNRSMKSDPRYDTAVRNLAVTHYKIASEAKDEAARELNIEKAKGYITMALDIAESPLTLLAQARLMILEEHYEEALKACERVEGIDPGMKEVYGLKKAALLKLNRLEEANKAHETWRFLNSHN